jgi:polysaccharide export outer membrane protein
MGLKFIRIGVILGLMLAGGRVLAQLGAEVKERPVVPVSGETKTGSGPESPGGGLQGERVQLYRIQESDVLEVSFTFAPEFDQVVTVQPDGFVTLKAAGRLRLAGKTLPQISDQIEDAYAGTLNRPGVSVALKDFLKPHFLVAGEVGHPGRYELRGETTLLQAITVAGGLTERSKHSQVVLFRRVSADLAEARVFNLKRMLRARDVCEDPRLQDGDMLFVPQNLLSKISRIVPKSSLGFYANGASF